MLRSAILTLLMFGFLKTYGQNISVTFTGTGAAAQIDSVTATNLRTDQSVTLPGNETLLLTENTGIPLSLELTDMGIVYPNPFSGRATFSTLVQKPQTVCLKLQNLVGQVVAQTKTFAEAGENEFSFYVNTAGIYMVCVTTEQGTASYKIICTDATESENRILYGGSVLYNHDNHNNQNHSNTPSPSGLKSLRTGYTLGYTSRDIIHYRCMSGIYTTILTDTPTYSKNYDIEFVACTDLDIKNYAIVKIGTQTWMAENLAYLPTVTPPYSGTTDSRRHYYVYDYSGHSTDEAKATANYKTYGVLYNWEVALSACPTGWHLPGDAEFKILIDYSGPAAGKKLKSTTGWSGNGNGSNSRGFNALPGGERWIVPNYIDGFNELGNVAYFWSELPSSIACYQSLHYNAVAVNSYFANPFDGYSVRCLKNNVNENLVPHAQFVITPESGTTSTFFSFDASGCSDAETPGSQLQVRWDWEGDGAWDTDYSTNKTETHQYLQAGIYAVTLEVKDAGNLSDTITKEMRVWWPFYDYRESPPREYKYIKIGSQTWMAENLAYLPSVSSSLNGSYTSPGYYVNGYYEGISVIGAKANANYTTYGVLYNWEAAKTACPPGWRLPMDEEWKTLEKELGMSQKDADTTGLRFSGFVGEKLKSTSGWLYGGNGSDSYGFTALSGGGLYSNSLGYYFGDPGGFTSFWSATGFDVLNAWVRLLYAGESRWNNTSVVRYYNDKSGASSVRCLQN